MPTISVGWDSCCNNPGSRPDSLQTAGKCGATGRPGKRSLLAGR